MASSQIPRTTSKIAGFALALAMAGASGAAAQAPGSGDRCPTRAADATAESRDAAMRLGYEISLQAFDPRLAKTWIARGSRVGEAPGYTVRRLVTKCQPRGRQHSCYVEVSLCR
jgi:hypothetical protein